MLDNHLLNSNQDISSREVENESVVTALVVFAKDEVREEDEKRAK